MKKILYSLFALILFNSNISAQTQSEHISSPVKWYTLSEAIELNKTNPKKIFIDVYTEWCGWCKVMDKKTFSDPNIASYLNQNYYPVKFDAESKDTIEYLGKEYINKGPGKRTTHELAFLLLNGRLSYPSTVYLDENLKPISAIPGYLEATKLQPILIYFTENLYLTTPFDQFEGYFNQTFVDSLKENSANIKWRSIEEVNELNKTNPKKTIIHFHADWSLSSLMMMETTYKHPQIIEYLNENYYMVKINALTKDTIIFNDNTYINEGINHPFHQFAVTLLSGRMSFPSVVYIEPNGQLISAVPGYMTPRNIEPILHYFIDDAYKTTPWEKYRDNFKSSISE